MREREVDERRAANYTFRKEKENMKGGGYKLRDLISHRKKRWVNQVKYVEA